VPFGLPSLSKHLGEKILIRGTLWLTASRHRDTLYAPWTLQTEWEAGRRDLRSLGQQQEHPEWH